MSAGTGDELKKIGGTEVVRIAARGPDLSQREPATEWVIRHGVDVPFGEGKVAPRA